MIALGKMTPATLEKAHDFMGRLKKEAKHFVVPPDILKMLKQDETAWKHFSRFSKRSKRIRISRIDTARYKPEIFRQQLRYFLKMTAQNKTFGMVQ